MLIPCPWCGPRDWTEFAYGGDAGRRRPSEDAQVETWHAYIHLRDNPEGPHAELWHHGAGCRMWFRLLRDTRTHEVLGSARPGEPLPGEPA
jgi:heterotetrameric sarcosine oxidase delta subunit